MAGPWDAYAPQPAAPAASGPWTQYAAPAPAGEFGFASAAEPAAPASAAAPTALPGQRSGLAANIGAGLAQTSAGVLDAASNPSGFIGKQIVTLGTGAYNLGARALGYQPMDPKLQQFLLDDGPGPAERLVDSGARAIGATAPSDVVPANDLERYTRAGVSGAAGMAGMGPGGLLGAAGALGIGALSGVGGQAASDAAPDDLKPAAGLLGGVIVPGAAAAGVAGARAIARPAINKLSEFVAPVVGKPNALLDAAGQPLTTEGGDALTATSNQARMAGERINGLVSDAPAVRSALDAAPPMAMTADGKPSGPTSFQLTRDPAMGQAERSISRTGPDPQDFRARQDSQNDARVQTVQGIAAGTDPAAATQFMKGTAADLLAHHDAEVARTQALATQQASDVTTQAEALRTVAQDRATQATNAIGGNLPADADNQVGAMLRAPLDAASQATRTQERALWDAVDPNGTLAVNMKPIKDGAASILGEMSPNAAPLAGAEAGVFKTAAELPDVQSFRDLSALRSRLTDAIRNERGPQGDPQAVRRMSMLLDGVHQAMEGGMQEQAGRDSSQVAAGTMHPDQAMVSRYQAKVDEYRAAQQQQATGTGRSAGGGDPAGASGGQAGVSGVDGAANQAGRGSRNAAGNAGLPGAEPLTPNFDADAAARYAAARQATRDRVATFKNAEGVGPALQGGRDGGTFRALDSAVPSLIVRTGAAGAETAKAYLAAGGTPEALSEAAAFSLRQAAMKDGVLDPAKYAAWAQQRQAFLSQIPDAAARFGSAADATRRAADVGKAVDSTIQQAAKTAQRTVDDAMATRATAIKAQQDSVAGKFLGDADPVRQMGSVINSKTAVADMAHLAELTKNDPEARAGLQGAVRDHILTALKGNSEGATSAETYFKGDQLQRLIRDRSQALEQIMSPKQMKDLRSVADSLAQSRLSSDGTRVGTGSDSAQNAAKPVQTFLSTFSGKLGAALTTTGGTLVGSLVGGIPGAVAGMGAGAGAAAVQAMRQAGIRNVDHLVSQALLNPALMRSLMAKVTPQNQASLMSGLAAQVGRLSLVSAAQSGQRQQFTAPSQNSLMPTGPAASSRGNALLH